MDMRIFLLGRVDVDRRGVLPARMMGVPGMELDGFALQIMPSKFSPCVSGWLWSMTKGPR